MAVTQRAQSGHVVTSTRGRINDGSPVAYAFDTLAMRKRTKSSAPCWVLGKRTARSDTRVGVEEGCPELGVVVPVGTADDGEMAMDVGVGLLAKDATDVPDGGAGDAEHAENSPTAAIRASSAVRTILIGRPPD
ncbi:MAG: hypothetical protein WAW82_12625 [Candidatus Lutibacillus vidarii]|nr:hypothetical protein [Candidatus Lutibacillus vidarii]